MSNLRERAIELLRKGNTYIDVLNELDSDSHADILEIRQAIYEAQRLIEKTDTESMKCAVEAFKVGETLHAATLRLQAVGYQSWDAGIMARKAQIAAAKETP